MTDRDARRLPIGAEITGDAKSEGGARVDFRVWAPRAEQVDLVLEGGPGKGTVRQASAEGDGYFRARVRGAGAGTLYRWRLDGGDALPDPASRSQPAGPHGASQVVDPSTFAWSDGGWGGVPPARRVLYELHVGTFTREGTWAAAMAELPELARLGVTVVEMMPIAEFPGRFGWGYDGVNLFAPSHLYGAPDDLRRFVDRAHALGVGVILDVVYNHVGPDGNYLPGFASHYFSERVKTDWGPAMNYDGEGSAPVRELVVSNARYWVEEYHFDGLRLDATQDIRDSSPDHLLAAIARAVRAAGSGRHTLVVAENEPQAARLARAPDQGGYGLDALWNDDLHHSAHVALTGHDEAYYSDYGGTPQELISAMKRGFLFQGQHCAWQKAPRGAPAFDLAPSCFVSFLDNHDQLANSASGERLHARSCPGRHRALTALVLLGPQTPMLFQGQEFSASSPFLYFADHHPELAAQVRVGRREFLAQFPSMARPEVAALLPPPDDVASFERCKLDFSERVKHGAAYAFHGDLLALRRDDRVFAEAAAVDGAVLSTSAFVLRFFGPDGDDRLLLVNLGADVRLWRAPEPLLAPPEGRAWHRVLSTEDPRYGGGGTPDETREGAWQLLGEAAIALRAAPKATP